MLLDSSTCDIDHILTKYNCARLEHMCNVALMEQIPGLPLFEDVLISRLPVLCCLCLQRK